MIILVPVDGENGQRGYGRNEHEIIGDMGEERRKLESRRKAGSSNRTQSIDGDSEAGFWLKRNGRTGTVRRGRGDSGGQLYAEYSRSSSSTGESHQGVTGTRKASLAMER
jgi:hypothetical protein